MYQALRPTRVHERYLTQAFALLCVVWAVRWHQRITVSLLAIASTITMHAILAMEISISSAVVQPSALTMYLGCTSGLIPPQTLPILLLEKDELLSWLRLAALWARQEWMVVLVHMIAFAKLIFEYIKMNRKSKAENLP